MSTPMPTQAPLLDFDALADIGAQIDDPGAFMTFARVNSECAQIARDLALIKKAQFVRWKADGDATYQALPNGLKHGKYINIGANLRVRCNFVDGRLHGIHETYYRSGCLETRSYFHDGERLGLGITFHNGPGERIKATDLILPQGDRYLFQYDNEGVKFTGSFKHSKKYGLTEVYDRDGVRTLVAAYFRGFPIITISYPGPGP